MRISDRERRTAQRSCSREQRQHRARCTRAARPSGPSPMRGFPRCVGLGALHAVYRQNEDAWHVNPRRIVQRVVSDEGAVRNVEHAVVRVELFDGGAPAGRITFSEDLLKVSIEKFSNSLVPTHVPAVFLRGAGVPDAFREAKRTAVPFHSIPLRRSQTAKSRRSLATWPVALTLYCAAAILPFSSTTKVERITPWTALPYIIFSP